MQSAVDLAGGKQNPPEARCLLANRLGPRRYRTADLVRAPKNAVRLDKRPDAASSNAADWKCDSQEPHSLAGIDPVSQPAMKLTTRQLGNRFWHHPLNLPGEYDAAGIIPLSSSMD